MHSCQAQPEVWVCLQIVKAEGAGVPPQLDADIASKEIASLQHEVCMATQPWPSDTLRQSSRAWHLLSVVPAMHARGYGSHSTHGWQFHAAW